MILAASFQEVTTDESTLAPWAHQQPESYEVCVVDRRRASLVDALRNWVALKNQEKNDLAREFCRTFGSYPLGISQWQTLPGRCYRVVVRAAAERKFCEFVMAPASAPRSRSCPRRSRTVWHHV